MTSINAVTSLTRDGEIAVVTLDSPPVNALSATVRGGLLEAVSQAVADPAVKAIVLICAGRTFIAGADITEFGKPPVAPSLAEVEAAIEAVPKPVVAAIHGTALGGGFETALACHYRVAVPSAKVGLPEVKLGLLPGGGGTQRLPRLVGVERALAMITSGEQVGAKAAAELGAIDLVVEEGRLLEGALGFARDLVARAAPLRRVRDLDDELAPARGRPEIFAEFRKENARKFRGFEAPESNIRCIEAAVTLPFDEGLAFERKLFIELMTGAQSAAQRHVFFAERQAWKIPDVPDDTPVRPIARVGIIGAGTMGGGIAMNFLNAGIPVTLVETSQAALDRGIGVIRKNYEASAKKGRMSEAEVERRMGLLTGTLDFEALAPSDLVIEAVFEDMAVKKQVFGKLDAIVKLGAILASNTSYLDIDQIAAMTKRPEDVIGLHFFSPANVMRLLEVVRGEKTAIPVIATAMQMAKRIGKVAVLARVCHGFIGNRMLAERQRQANRLILEGAMPWDVDRVLYDFGLPMGPFAMADLAGLDIGWSAATSKSATIREILCEMDRRGQKTGAGFYDYDESRRAKPSPVVAKIIEEFAAKTGAVPRQIADQEILERCLYPMINEGAKILEEGRAIRASDIDIVWINGYGWPVYRGGPMFWGDLIGLDKVLAALRGYEAKFGAEFKPADLLVRLVEAGKGFKDL
ncbi:MAG TPA: 3-hydroxyacyl-CoA dehydrogenase NAD-binding domain-containing protein [Aliidongia sp.]|nr:3-hydroxyacyl-CoA dehydrogenase NAD-binding domain-containing protein [Aliidongia sp.]